MGYLRFKDTSNSTLSSIEIAGDRVKLRPIDIGVAYDIHKEFTADVTRYMMPKPANSILDIYEFIAVSKLKLQLQHDLVFTIFNAENGAFLGVCGVHGKKDNGVPELGIWLKRSSHGHHYGREAIHSLVDWIKKNLMTLKLHYPVDNRNVSSCKIPESLAAVIIRRGTRKSLSGSELIEVVYEIDLSTV